MRERMGRMIESRITEFGGEIGVFVGQRLG